MAKSKQEEVRVTVLPAPGAAPAPQRRTMKRYRKSGKKTQGTSGIAVSARKAANTAKTALKEEPMRAGVGVIAGNILGNAAGGMIHDAALETAKKTPEKAAEQARNQNLYLGAGAGVLAIGSALFKGKGLVSRYVLHAATSAASHALGEAAAIDRQMKKPLPAPAKVQGTDGTEEDNDPFDRRGETGASRRERVVARRQAMAKNIAAQLRKEDPQGAGTEGPELEGYVEGLLEDASERIQGAEEAIAEVGVLPLMAAASLAPQTIKALAALINMQKPDGAAVIQQQQEQQQAPVTGAMLELEGEAPEELNPQTGSARARELRAEARQVDQAERKKRRTERIARRKARRDARKGGATPAPLKVAQSAQTPPPIIIREVVRTVNPQEDAPLVVIPSDEEIMDLAEGRPLRVQVRV